MHRQLDNSQETGKKFVMMNPYWIVGFIDAEGHFMVTKPKLSSGRRRVVFSISQHEKDIQIFKKLQDYFKCGYVIRNGSQRNVFEYRIASAKSIISHQELVPFLDKYQLQTRKRLEYLDFRKMAYLIKHLPKDSAAKLRRSLDQLIAGLQQHSIKNQLLNKSSGHDDAGPKQIKILRIGWPVLPTVMAGLR